MTSALEAINPEVGISTRSPTQRNFLKAEAYRRVIEGWRQHGAGDSPLASDAKLEAVPPVIIKPTSFSLNSIFLNHAIKN